MLLVSTLATPAPLNAPSNAGSSDAAGGFSLSLGIAGEAPAADAAIPPSPTIDPAEAITQDSRQALAATGSDLPPADDIAADPDLLWIAYQSPQPPVPAKSVDAPRLATGDIAAPTAQTPPPAVLVALLDDLPPAPAKAASPATSDDDPDKDDAPIAVDPAFVAAAIVPIVPAVPPSDARSTAISLATPGVPGIAAHAVAVPTAPVQAESTTVPATPAAIPASAPASIAVPAAAPSGPATAAILSTGAAEPAKSPTALPGDVIIFAPGKETAPIRAADAAGPVVISSPATATAPVALASEPSALPIGVALPAARIFAAAIAAAARPNRIDREGQLSEGTALAAPVAQGAGAASLIAPAAGVDNSPLDTRREDWTRQLLDRIDALRDAADAGDTRIRLVPAGLGKIDVALRQDGDVLHVHFTADVPATRALLTDAQPRLVELAAERGLRLGQSGVGQSGAGAQGQGWGQDQRRPFATQTASQPAAPPRADADDETVSDQRIA